MVATWNTLSERVVEEDILNACEWPRDVWLCTVQGQQSGMSSNGYLIISMDTGGKDPILGYGLHIEHSFLCTVPSHDPRTPGEPPPSLNLILTLTKCGLFTDAPQPDLCHALTDQIPDLTPVHNATDLCCVINLYCLSVSPGVMGAVVSQRFSSPPVAEAGGVTGGHGGGQGKVTDLSDVLSLNLCNCHGL